MILSEKIFTARNLTKKYKQLFALDGLNMEITRGDIYGLVGENGAGKTTLIRIIAGLAVQTSGEISLFGVSDNTQLTKQRKRIGGFSATPAIYPNLTAVENMEICRLQRGIPGKECIARTLESVGLDDVEKQPAKYLSLGKKQRLGIAKALLYEPEFLILDEPANGIDPGGVVRFREMLKRLNRENGITILISSHDLPELCQLATSYCFIHKGKALEQITADQLDEKCKKHLHIRADNIPQAVVVLETILHTRKFEVLPDHIRLYDFLNKSGVVSNALFTGGVTIEEITTRGDNLEKYYMSLIGR